MSRMVPANDAELGQLVRRTVWRHVGRLAGTTRSRDRQLVTLVAQRHPGAVQVLGRTAITAAARQLGPDTCSWDALRMLAASNDEPMPLPTPGLIGLLGRPCSRCRAAFEAEEVARRERALHAAAGGRRRSKGGLRRRVTGPQPAGLAAAAPVRQPATTLLPVRDALALAHQRQRRRDEVHAAAAQAAAAQPRGWSW